MKLTSQFLQLQTQQLLELYNSEIGERKDKKDTPESDLDDLDYRNLIRNHNVPVGRPENRPQGIARRRPVDGEIQFGKTISHLKDTLIKIIHLRDLLTEEKGTADVDTDDKDKNTLRALQSQLNGNETQNQLLLDLPEQLQKIKAVKSGSEMKLLELLDRNYHKTYCRTLGSSCGWMLNPCCEEDLKYNTKSKLCCRKGFYSRLDNYFSGLYGVCLPQIYKNEPCPVN